MSAEAILTTANAIDEMYAKAAESLATAGRENRYGGFSYAARWTRAHDRQIKAARRLTNYLITLTIRVARETPMEAWKAVGQA